MNKYMHVLKTTTLEHNNTTSIVTISSILDTDQSIPINISNMCLGIYAYGIICSSLAILLIRDSFLDRLNYHTYNNKQFTLELSGVAYG